MLGRAQLTLVKNLATFALMSFALGGCLLGEEVVNSDSTLTISGVPPSSLNANSAFQFTPTIRNANGDTLSFSVSGLPTWASFDNATGRLSGTPSDADIGTYTGIQLTVSDGTDNAMLGPFSITVQAMGTGAVTLNWTPPTENTDGTVLVNLAGYRIYWGTTFGNYPNSVTIDNPSISTYMVENLAPGTYRFVATSFNSAGMESSFSNEAIRQVQ